MSSGHATIYPDNALPHFKSVDLGTKLGLATPGSKLTLALGPLIWDNHPIYAPRGILVFGPPDCGGEQLVHAVLHDRLPHVQKFTLRLGQVVSDRTGNSIRTLFDTARARTTAVIVIEALDEFAQHIPKLMEEIYATVVDKPELKVFVIACVAEPWIFGESHLQLFRTKINIPIPTYKEKAMLLDYFLGQVKKNKRLKKDHFVRLPDLELVANLPNLRKDLERCANEAYEIAGREKLERRPQESLDEAYFTAMEIQTYRETLEITRVHLEAAGMRIVPELQLNYSDSGVVQRLQKFKDSWDVKKREDRKDKDEEEWEEKYRKRETRKTTRCEKVLYAVADWVNPWL